MSDPVIIHRISIASEEFADRGWRRVHFGSKTEAELTMKAANESGLTAVYHVLEVPTEAAALANFLDEYRPWG